MVGGGVVLAMAADNHSNDDWASADDQAEDADTEIIDTSVGKFEYVPMPELKLVRAADQYGMLPMLSGQGAEDAAQQALASGGFGKFMENVVANRIVYPPTYWYEPDDPAPESFDLADFDDMEDLFELVAGIAGMNDANQLQERVEEFQPE